jgi:hypothetical protein
MTILQMGVILFLFHRALRVHQEPVLRRPCPRAIRNSAASKLC